MLQRQRMYKLYVPDSYDPATPAPLVVALHGAGETPNFMAYNTGFNEIADREGFLVVYPQGRFRRFDAWGDSDDGDLQFVLAILDEIKEDYAIDDRRIYATGASNGGFMTFRLLCKTEGIFAAGAPVMALLPKPYADQGLPGHPVPLMMVNGTGDPLVPYNARKVWKHIWWDYDAVPVPEVIAYWTDNNGCSGEPVRKELPEIDGDGTNVTMERYTGCTDDAEVVLYTVHNGGHTWPGGREPAPGFIVGGFAEDFNASEAIWEFFKRHRLN